KLRFVGGPARLHGRAVRWLALPSGVAGGRTSVALDARTLRPLALRSQAGGAGSLRRILGVERVTASRARSEQQAIELAHRSHGNAVTLRPLGPGDIERELHGRARSLGGG